MLETYYLPQNQQYTYVRTEEFNPETGQMEERFFLFPLLALGAGFGLGALAFGGLGYGWGRRRWWYGRPYGYYGYGYPYYGYPGYGYYR